MEWIYLILFILIIIVFLFFLTKYMKKVPKKIIVFDMDETLGSFVQLGIISNSLETELKRNLHPDEINALFTLFPNYLRPGILSILKYLKTQKQHGVCQGIYIYTNNQGPKKWALSIKEYFENKVQYPLFDKVIHAYKTNGVHVEKKRTSHNKTLKDFMRCTKTKEPFSLCFIDDQYHPYMLKQNVQYIHIREYEYYYKPEFIIQKLNKSPIFNSISLTMLNSYLNSYHEKHIKHELKEKQTSKQLIYEIQRFLKTFGNRHTRVNKHKMHAKTHKQINKKHYKYIY